MDRKRRRKKNKRVNECGDFFSFFLVPSKLKEELLSWLTYCVPAARPMQLAGAHERVRPQLRLQGQHMCPFLLL